MKIVRGPFTYGSIQRKTFQRYRKRYLYRYRGVSADILNGNEYIVDQLFDDLFEEAIIGSDVYDSYMRELSELLRHLPAFLEETDEAIYRDILAIRERYRSEEIDRYIGRKKAALYD